MHKNIFKRRFVLALGLAAALGIAPAATQAATLDWDISGGAGITGGAGNWDTTLTNFTADGGATNVAWVNANNDTARFQGTGGAVALQTGITVGGLDFDVTGYTISGSTLTLGTASTFNVDAGTATIDSIIAGAAGNTLTVTGAGTLVIGNNANTFSGNVIVDGGKLSVVGNNGAAADPTRLGPAGKTITLTNGGTYISTATTTNPTGTNSKNFVIGAGGGTLQTDSAMTLDDGTQFSGTGDLTKTGPGQLNIKTQAFSYSGANVYIQAGEIELNNAGSLGAGNLTIKISSGAVLDMQNTLTGTKSIEVAGTGASSAGAIQNNSTTAGGVSGSVTLTGNTSFGGSGQLTFPGVVSDSGSNFTLTKVGTGNVILSNAANSWGGATTISAGTLNFSASGSYPASTTAITIGAAAGGAGFGFVIDQAFLAAEVTNTTGGSILIGANNANNFDFSASGLNYGTTTRFGGMVGTTATYTGTLTPAGTATAPYLLGGPGTIIFSNANALTGARNLDVAGGGTVTLSNTNDFTGTTSINGATLSFANTAALGTSTTALTLSNSGTLLYSGSSVSLGRNLATGTNGGTVNVSTTATTLTIPSLTGGSSFGKAGTGTLVISGSAAISNLTMTAGTLTLSAATSMTGTYTGNGGTLNVNDGATVAGAATFNGTSAINIPTGETLTMNNSVFLGNNANVAVTLSGGGSFVMNNNAQIFKIAENTNDGSNQTGTLDATGLSNFSVTASSIRLGLGTDQLTGIPQVTMTLPSAAGSTSSLITPAAGLIVVGGDSESGATTPQTFLTLGGGSNTLTTGGLYIGAGKNGGSIAFPAGSAGSLNLTHPTAGSKVTMIVGRSISATAQSTASIADFTTTGAVNQTLGSLTLGLSHRDNVNTTTATYTLNAGSGLVTADSVRIGEVAAGTNATNVMSYVSTFNLQNGTFEINAGGSGFVTGPTAGATHNRTLTMNVSGGTLNMNATPITLVSTGTGTTTLNLSGTGLINMQGGDIGNLTTLNFTGGTLRNLGTLNRALTQSNTTASLLDVVANNATITGLYTLNGGTATIASGRSLTVPLGLVLNGGTISGGTGTAGTIVGDITATSGNIAPGSSPGTLAVTGSLNLAAAMNLSFELDTPGTVGSGINDLITVSNNLTLDGTLNVTALGGFGPGTYTLLTYGGTLTNNTLDAVLPVGYTGGIDLSTPGQVNLVVNAIPEPGLLVGGALGLLGLLVVRRRCRLA